MKRIWSFWSLGIVLLLIALLLTGCGKKNSPPTDPVIGEPQDFEISIKMPVVYEDVDDDSKLYPIPSGKTVKFYFFQDIQDIDDIDEDQPLNPIHTITGTTPNKESMILGTVPVGLNGKECCLFAVVVLKDDFGLEELEEKTLADIDEAFKNKSILLGQISDEQDPKNPKSWKRYTLNPNLPPIEDFEFYGW